MAALRAKVNQNQSQSLVRTSQVGLEETEHECRICKDTGLIVYRVHKDTEWITDEKTGHVYPKKMVLEEDFFDGKVCDVKDAWKWRDTYAKQCECVKRKRIQRIMKASQITDEFKRLGFRNFIIDGKPQMIKDAYDCALEYYQEFDSIRKKRRNSIALLGQPGAGKTHLLTALANNFMKKRGIPVLYFPYVEGFNDLKDDFDKLEEKLEHMKTVDILFIDDLFKPTGRDRKPRATEWQIEQMYAVINYRYLNYKPIMVSSELTVDELADVDEALGTRIYEMCSDFTVVIKGDRKKLNHRLAGA
jgi:DNA replication protein DnaC